jgi:hypothetical protein
LKEIDTGKEKNSCQDSSSGVERNKQRRRNGFFETFITCISEHPGDLPSILSYAGAAL